MRDLNYLECQSISAGEKAEFEPLLGFLGVIAGGLGGLEASIEATSTAGAIARVIGGMVLGGFVGILIQPTIEIAFDSVIRQFT